MKWSAPGLGSAVILVLSFTSKEFLLVIVVTLWWPLAIPMMRHLGFHREEGLCWHSGCQEVCLCWGGWVSTRNYHALLLLTSIRSAGWSGWILCFLFSVFFCFLFCCLDRAGVFKGHYLGGIWRFKGHCSKMIRQWSKEWLFNDGQRDNQESQTRWSYNDLMVTVQRWSVRGQRVTLQWSSRLQTYL